MIIKLQNKLIFTENITSIEIVQDGGISMVVKYTNGQSDCLGYFDDMSTAQKQLDGISKAYSGYYEKIDKK